MLRTRRVLLGRLCWWVQPVVILTELIAVAVVAAPYSLLHNTISDLGARGCGTVRYPAAEVPVCSPAHVVVNGGMIVGGLLLVLGAVLLSPTYAFGKAGIAARVEWGGLLERTAIWPVLLALPLLACAQPVPERGQIDPDPRTHG